MAYVKIDGFPASVARPPDTEAAGPAGTQGLPQVPEPPAEHAAAATA